MTQKGEVTLFGVLLLVVISGLLTLCGLELEKGFRTLKRRTGLFLCVKETKGELQRYLIFMGRTNWALENIGKAQLIAVLIPGLQGVGLEADKMKKVIKALQNSTLPLYLGRLKELKNRGCPLDPQMLLTPFRLATSGYKRELSEAASLRKKQWTYHFLKTPYLLTLNVEASSLVSIHPKISFEAREKGVILSSLFSSQ